MKNPQTVCVYFYANSIGDLFMGVPLFALLRHRLPQARLVWGIGKETAYTDTMRKVFKPCINDVAVFPDIDTIRCAPLTQRVQLLFSRPSARHHFDAVLLRRMPFFARIVAKRVLLADKVLSAHSAILSFSDFSFWQWQSMFSKHNTILMRRLIDRLVAPQTNEPPYPAASFSLGAYRDLARRLLPDGKNYIGFAPGSGRADKRWPLDNFIALAKNMRAKGATPVFFIGPNERDLVAPILQNCPDALLPEINAPPQMQNFALAMALGERLTQAVVNDSGIAHILATVQTPLTILYGPYPIAHYRPLIPEVNIFEARHYGRAQNMETIPLAAVQRAVEAKLS